MSVASGVPDALPPSLERARALVAPDGRLAHVLSTPGLSVALALFANSVARPYAGFRHDAALYLLQVLNRLRPGVFAEDLFLKYGSQDQFSVFSLVLASLARLTGVPAAFFLVYVSSVGLLCWATDRLLGRIFSNPVVRTAALLLTVTVPLGYGGLEVFHVHEPFLTPRLIATAFVVLALAESLARRHLVALSALAAGFPFHPIMAAGGAAICGIAWIHERRFRALWYVALFGVVGVGLWFLRDSRLLQLRMDETWRSIVLAAAPYNFPSEWTPADWVNGLAGLVTLIAASLLLGQERRDLAGIFLIAAVVAVVGLVATVLFAQLPYAFFFQAQPYRALWLVRVLQIPAAMTLVGAAWQHGSGGRALAFLALGAACAFDLVAEGVAFFFIALLLALPFSGAASRAIRRDWLPWSVGIALITAIVFDGLGRGGYVLAHGFGSQPAWDTLDTPLLLALNMASALGVVFVAALPLVARAGVGSRQLRIWAVAVTVVLWFASYLWVSSSFSPLARDTEYIANLDAVDTAIASGRPVVYSDRLLPAQVWSALGMPAYFSLYQVAGVMFNKETALESQRRAALTEPFQSAMLRGQGDPAGNIGRMAMRLFPSWKTRVPPRATDALRVCGEPGVGLLILSERFEHLSPVSNGSVYLYDCTKLVPSVPQR